MPMSETVYDQIELSREGCVAVVRMNRPERRNAQSRVMREELDDAFQRCVNDDEVGSIVLLGAGDHFSAGHDLGSPEELHDRGVRGYPGDPNGRHQHMWKYNVDNALRWRELPKPTIAGVQGYCIFAGCLVASAMDVVIAADDARFLPEHVQYFSLPWDVGHRKAREILLEGRFVLPDEAEQLGMVNRVVPRPQLEQTVMELAGRFAQTDPFRLQMTKEAINAAQDAQGFRTAIENGYLRWAMLSEAEILAEAEHGTARRVEGRLRRPRAERAFQRLAEQERPGA